MPFEGLRFSSPPERWVGGRACHFRVCALPSPPERWLGGRALSLSFIVIFITILISNKCKTSVSEGVVRSWTLSVKWIILRLSWSSLPTCLNVLISDYSSVLSVNVWNQGNWGAWTRTGPSWWCLMPPDGAMKVMSLWSSQGQIHLYRMDNICWLVKAVSGKSWVKDWLPKFLRIESPQSRWKGVWFNSSSEENGGRQS